MLTLEQQQEKIARLNRDILAVKGDARQVLRRNRSAGIRACGFGNSVMRANAVVPIGAVSTFVTVEVPAGAKVLPVTSSTGFANGDTIETTLYDGTLFSSTVTVSGNELTLTTPLPKLLHGAVNGGNYLAKKFGSIYGQLYPSTAWLRVLNAQMGNPFDFVNIYGYGGANSTTMIKDFKSAVLDYKPQVCFVQVLENDIRDIGAGIMTIAESKANVLSIIKQCQEDGIAVVIGTSLPSAAFNTTATVNAFDNLNGWLMGLNKQSEGVLVMPMHSLWTDQTSTTARSPLSIPTYTDTLLHPNALGAALLVRDILYPRLKNVYGQGYMEVWPGGLGDATNYSSNPKMRGTTGIVNAPVTGQAPQDTNCSSISTTGVTSSSFVSSLIDDGLQKSWQIIWSHTGGSDAVANAVYMRLFPITCPAGTMVVGRAEVEILNPVNLHGYGMMIDFGNGQSSRSIEFATADADLGAVLPVGRIVLETVPMVAPAAGAGSARLYFWLSPKAGVASAGATMIWHRSSIAAI